MSSPRSWGCFCWWTMRCPPVKVFPTLVGVFLYDELAAGYRASLPHARGGVSAFTLPLYLSILSSPRSWGCFQERALIEGAEFVFPTLVGVFLNSLRSSRSVSGLPHARGGVSFTLTLPVCLRWSSPRSWGCFCSRLWQTCPASVFPTLVGVFPRPGAKGWSAR